VAQGIDGDMGPASGDLHDGLDHIGTRFAFTVAAAPTDFASSSF
jgi:hypothetical protein